MENGWHSAWMREGKTVCVCVWIESSWEMGELDDAVLCGLKLSLNGVSDWSKHVNNELHFTNVCTDTHSHAYSSAHKMNYANTSGITTKGRREREKKEKLKRKHERKRNKHYWRREKSITARSPSTDSTDFPGNINKTLSSTFEKRSEKKTRTEITIDSVQYTLTLFRCV